MPTSWARPASPEAATAARPRSARKTRFARQSAGSGRDSTYPFDSRPSISLPIDCVVIDA